MSLAHAIASILLQSPRTGYDLSKEFNEKVSCYWQATSQQIYRELARMQEKDWVEVEVLPQSVRPDKKIYSLTDAGRQELISWITEPSEATAIREELLVKVRSGFIVSEDILIREVERRKQFHQQKLESYRSRELEFGDPDHLSRPQRHIYLTLRCGIRYETMWIEWCDEAIASLLMQKEGDR
ncbi:MULTISPECIES: PadR family transcriptional regulator [unclassified Anabaena]|uniref:PadR family transcriptional regulator n=1 Tax=unclassified Anabaena TaxID=2619674 RepID=UPI0014484554|nr:MULTISPECIES: PadR family transcriptional regulator [unclassified Anabaena]MTJ08362.1 PadR family transcriptional regulator [Anabaena sp. UHCC 0204]MTJ51539.1 PadR family transcriptional regulator [Anabaena sp. UHCC 0253]